MKLTPMLTRPALSGVRLFSTAAKAKELVANHIATNKVAIFSKTYCPHCARAKEAIGALPQAFGVLELDVHPLGAEMQSALLDMTAQKTVRHTCTLSRSIQPPIIDPVPGTMHQGPKHFCR